jgi:arginyl-tRNA synthetase
LDLKRNTKAGAYKHLLFLFAKEYDTLQIMDARARAYTIIKKGLANLYKKQGEVFGGEFAIVPSSQEEFGDYIALRYAGELGMHSREFASALQEEIARDKKDAKFFARVEVAGPGFLNFFLAPSYLHEQVSKIVHDTEWGKGDRGKNKKVNIEFLSANPTGQIQVGNARWGFYGDALGNILEAAGYSVTKEYYINNAKTSNQIAELGKTALGQGSTYFTPYLEGKIRELAPKLKKIKGRTRENFAKAGFLLAHAVQKDTARMLAKSAGIHFDVWTQEENLYKRNLPQKTIVFLRRKGLVYEQEGALWLSTTKFGDDKDKVIVRSTGEFGYYLADIAYHRDKIARGYKRIIDILGADHQGHVKPMEVAMQILGYKGQFTALIGQLVQAKGGGKFSKRAGNAIALEELIEEVGIDAVRFFYLAKSLDAQMEFDIDLAREQSQKNPIYYVQYTHARIASILRKKQETRNKRQAPRPKVDLSFLHETGELRLMRKLMHFPEVIDDIAQDFQVHHLTTYVLELAQEFNQFYRDYKVLTNEQDIRIARLALAQAAGVTLRVCLTLLGIHAPQKMIR